MKSQFSNSYSSHKYIKQIITFWWEDHLMLISSLFLSPGRTRVMTLPLVGALSLGLLSRMWALFTGTREHTEDVLGISLYQHSNLLAVARHLSIPQLKSKYLLLQHKLSEHACIECSCSLNSATTYLHAQENFLENGSPWKPLSKPFQLGKLSVNVHCTGLLDFMEVNFKIQFM